MNADMAKVRSLIENAFASAIEKLTKDESGNFISDLYVQVDTEGGESQVYDDGGHLIEKIVIFDWVNSNEEENTPSKWAAASVEVILTILSIKNIFDVLRLMRPFSVSLTDEDSVVIGELLLINDGMLRSDDPLLKDLDANLNDLLVNLLADVE